MLALLIESNLKGRTTMRVNLSCKSLVFGKKIDATGEKNLNNKKKQKTSTHNRPDAMIITDAIIQMEYNDVM